MTKEKFFFFFFFENRQKKSRLWVDGNVKSELLGKLLGRFVVYNYPTC